MRYAMNILGKFIFSIFAGYNVAGSNLRSEYEATAKAETTPNIDIKALDIFNQNSYTVAPNNIMSAEERTAILNLVNYKMRGKTSPTACNLSVLTWDDDLQNALEKFVIDNTGYAFFSTDHGFPQGPIVLYQKYNWLMYHLMKLPEFVQWNDTTIYITHDTQKNRPMSVYKIFQFREKQRFCFSYSSCSNNTYSNFESCMPDEFDQECHYASNFYIRLLTEFDKIACVKTGVPGPFTPNNQPNGFVCYGTAKKALTFTNDIPYQKCLKRASECSANSSSYKGLCKIKATL